MGWFLSKKKKKRSKPRRSTSLAEQTSWDPKRTLTGLKALGVFALAVTLVIGWRYGERYLLDYAKQRQDEPVTAAMIELVDAPAWMSEGIQDQIRKAAAIEIDPDPMDGRSLRETAGALRANPWVREVVQVTRRSGGHVLVSALYRQPVAVVEAKDGYHLVDFQGVCLPGLYQAHEVKGMGLVMVRGVSTPPPANAGEVWEGEEVPAGLSLIRLLAREPYMGKIRSFDVSQRDGLGRLRLVLHTEDGMIRWGLPPGEEHAIEPDAQIKLGWLRKLALHDASLSSGGQIIDINGPVPGQRQP